MKTDGNADPDPDADPHLRLRLTPRPRLRLRLRRLRIRHTCDARQTALAQARHCCCITADLLMGLLLSDVLAGSTKAEMQTWIRTTLPTSVTGTKARLMDQMMTWAQQSADNHSMLIETVLAYRPHRLINSMVVDSGGRSLKRKACAIAEFIRLDSLHADARADADASAGGADGAGDCGVLVPVDVDARTKRHRLRRKLTKLWVRLARRRLRTQRSQIIIKEIHWCVRNTSWTLTLIKQHVADKSGGSLDIGHH